MGATISGRGHFFSSVKCLLTAIFFKKVIPLLSPIGISLLTKVFYEKSFLAMRSPFNSAHEAPFLVLFPETL